MNENPSAGNFFVVAGEASGDHHLSKVVSQLKNLVPELSVWGMGGDHLRSAGGEVLKDYHGISVVGLKEVFRILPEALKVLRDLKSEIRKRKPRGALLVDFPDFNFRLARFLRAQGIPVYWYISPQMWAWRKGRVKYFHRDIQKLYSILPFEREFFQKHGVKVKSVGHPILDESWVGQEVHQSELRGELWKGESVEWKTHPLIALLPGSRKGEIRHHLDALLETAKILQKDHPSTRFLLPVAAGLDEKFIEDRIKEFGLEKSLVPVGGKAVRVLQAADLAVVASGTATLEAALVGVPTVVVYRLASFSVLFFRTISSYRGFASLANLIAGKEVFPELIQEDFEPEKVAGILSAWLAEPSQLEAIRKELAMLPGKLGGRGGSLQVAEDLLKEIGWGKSA